MAVGDVISEIITGAANRQPAAGQEECLTSFHQADDTAHAIYDGSSSVAFVTTAGNIISMKVFINNSIYYRVTAGENGVTGIETK